MSSPLPPPYPGTMAPQPPPMLPQQLEVKPPAAGVFAIAHLILGGIGVLMMLFGLMSIAFRTTGTSPWMSSSGGMSESSKAAIMHFQERFRIFYDVELGLSAVINALIIVAGVMLMTNRRTALRWSAAYSCASILHSVGLICAMVWFFSTMVREMMGSMGSRAGDPGLVITIAMSVVGLVRMIYPVLALIFLSKPEVKGWYARRGA